MPTQTLSLTNNTQELSEKAQACLEQAVEVTGVPLYHMGNIAVFNSKNSFDLMQATINYLTCKAQAKTPFSIAFVPGGLLIIGMILNHSVREVNLPI